jgi:hypothetical protein
MERTKKSILSFVMENCNGVDEYVESVNKQGLVQELRTFGVTIPEYLYSSEVLRQIFKTVLEDSITKGYNAYYKKGMF